jgi:DNA-binding NarL/FixJ family response regulator
MQTLLMTAHSSTQSETILKAACTVSDVVVMDNGIVEAPERSTRRKCNTPNALCKQHAVHVSTKRSPQYVLRTCSTGKSS